MKALSRPESALWCYTFHTITPTSLGKVNGYFAYHLTYKYSVVVSTNNRRRRSFNDHFGSVFLGWCCYVKMTAIPFTMTSTVEQLESFTFHRGVGVT